MKVFVISLLLFSLMLIGIGVNHIYINEVSDRLEASLDALPDIGEEGCVTAAARLVEDWEKHADTVCLSVAYNVVDRVGEQASALLTCAECGDVYGFYTARTVLRHAISDMRRSEKFTVGNIF